MRGVNDRNFLNLWQMIYRVSCPGLEATRWRVDAVEWRRERHSFTGPAYSCAHEVHMLERDGGTWRLMVVSEYWWDEKHAVVKSTIWARMLRGTPQAVLAWVVAQEKRQRAAPMIEFGTTTR